MRLSKIGKKELVYLVGTSIFGLTYSFWDDMVESDVIFIGGALVYLAMLRVVGNIWDSK